MSLWLGKLCVRQQCFQIRHKTLFIENPPKMKVPLAAATSVRARMCLKVVSGERRFWQLTKSHPCRTHNSPSHSDICFCCNLSGDAVDTFLKSCVAERIISSATAAFELRVLWSGTDARAAVNVQLHNVAVVGKKCASGGNVFKFVTKPSLLKIHRKLKCAWLQPQACEQGCV